MAHWQYSWYLNCSNIEVFALWILGHMSFRYYMHGNVCSKFNMFTKDEYGMPNLLHNNQYEKPFLHVEKIVPMSFTYVK